MAIDVEEDELEGLTDEEKEARRRAIAPPIAAPRPSSLPGGNQPSTFSSSEGLTEPKSIGAPIEPMQLQSGPAQRPAYGRLEKLETQDPWETKKWGKVTPEEAQRGVTKLGIGGKIGRVAEAIGSAISPAAVQYIPGTELNYQRKLGGAEKAAKAEESEITNKSEEELRAAQAEEQRSLARKNASPQAQAGKTPEEQFMMDALHGGANGGPKTDQDGKPYNYLSAHEAWKRAEQVKEPPPHKDMTAKPGTVNGRPTWGIQTEEGWIDPETRQVLHGFSPQPTFAETGLYEQTSAFDSRTGQMVPARFDKRSGRIVGYNGETHLIPIGPEAAKQIGTNLEGAREADTRLETMSQNYEDGLKGNQQAMLSLLANHIGMTLGLQKGARITQAIYDEAMASAPITGRIAAHFDSNGYLTGVVLTPEQMKQMLELGEQKRSYLWTQAEQAGKTYGIPLQTEGLRKKVGGGAGGSTVHYVEGNDHYNIPAEKEEKFKKAHPNAKRQ